MPFSKKHSFRGSLLEYKNIECIIDNNNMVYGETFAFGQTVQILILEIIKSPNGLYIHATRKGKEFLSKLITKFVETIRLNVVNINKIVRIDRYNSVILINSTEGIDPVKSVVGYRGTHLIDLINELQGEKYIFYKR